MATSNHFVLVHGACHGAWCWYKVATLLKLSGHRVTTLDLGASGINPKRLDQIPTIADYLQPLMDLMASLSSDETVILVGHSYGGLSISMAMESFAEKISVAVFVSANMPTYVSPPATSIFKYFRTTQVESLLDCELLFEQGPENPPTTVLFGKDYMSTKVYKNCQTEDLELAKMLIRPQALFVEEFNKESMLTKERFGSVSRVFVVCEEDEVMTGEFQRWTVESSPPAEVKSIEEAGHMVMLSKPKQLSLCLQEIAQKYH